MCISKYRLVFIGLFAVLFICLMYAWAHNQNEGDEPYTPTRLEWLAVELNGMRPHISGVEMVYKARDNNMLELHVTALRDTDMTILTKAIDTQEELVSDIAKSHGWDTWLKFNVGMSVLVKHTKRHTGINFTYEDIDGISVGYGKGFTTEKHIVGTAIVIIVENKDTTMYGTVLNGEDATMWKAGTPQLNRSGKLANSGSIPIDRLNEIKRITVHITVEDENDDGTKRKMETSTEITDFTDGKSAVIIVEDKKDSLITTTHPITDSIRTFMDSEDVGN